MTGNALALDTVAAADLTADPDRFATAEEQLRERGLLLASPWQTDEAVRSDLATVLGTTFAPELLCVLRLTDRSARVEREYFSLSSECLAYNRVDAEGRHQFAEFDDPDELIQTILESAWAPDAPGRTPEPLEQLLPASDLMAMLLVVDQPGATDAESRSIAWLRAQEGLWLVAPERTDGEPAARPVSRAELRQELVQTLGPFGGAV
jgi:hypothetical protein